MKLLSDGAVAVPFSLDQEIAPVQKLLRKYLTVPIALADACLVRMAELVSESAVFTPDNDGGIDVVVVNRDGPPYVLRNIVPNRGHWIMLRVLDEHGRDALGATITMQAGGRTITADVRSASSYCAANDRIHVGLGAQTRVTGITVRWPDGARENFGDLPADAIHTLRRGAGQPGAGG